MSCGATVEASALFREMADAHPGVEVWPDEGFTEGGWSHAWIVSRLDEGPVRNQPYVRHRGTLLRRRAYNEEGNDLWVSAT